MPPEPRPESAIRWITAFLDRPLALFGPAAEFWAAVTGSTVSPRRGEHDEFATLEPATGDACHRVQGVASGGGAHLDLETADPAALVARAGQLGAALESSEPDLAVLRSPAGLGFCVLPWSGASRRPDVVEHANGARSRLDQVCLDLPPSSHADEVDFWVGLTGWPYRVGLLPEFGLIRPPRDSGLPIQILVQRMDEEGPAGAHVDIACSDLTGVQEVHERYGARLVWRGPHWVVLRDPADGVYCLTARHPETGRLPH
jgi:hypothetical protein